MQRKLLLILVIAAIAGTIYYLESQKPMRVATGSDAEISTPAVKDYPRAKELASPEGFINIDNITIGELIGKKVILVDFWTYSCINCQRTQPFLNAWYDKYREAGLEIIGVHTPEFEFEKDIDNVRAAVRKAGIKYPVVQDNDYATWQAYSNRYWPRKYLIDIDGYIVYDHIGEGAYEETERKIQELLKVAGDISHPEAINIDSSMPVSPEIYFGALRNMNYLGNGIAGLAGRQHFNAPEQVKANVLYLGGDWNVASEYAENLGTESKIVFRYQARKVYMVASAGKEITVRVLRDGVVYKTMTINADELYTLIDDSEYGEHLLEIIPDANGLKIFTFTFG